MLSRRSLFALLGAAVAAPVAAVVAPEPGKVIISVLDPATTRDVAMRYTFTSYGRGYVVTEREVGGWFDPRGHFHVSGYDAQGQRVTESVDA